MVTESTYKKFKDLNVLGMDFLALGKCCLTVNMVTRMINIFFDHFCECFKGRFSTSVWNAIKANVQCHLESDLIPCQVKLPAYPRGYKTKIFFGRHKIKACPHQKTDRFLHFIQHYPKVGALYGFYAPNQPDGVAWRGCNVFNSMREILDSHMRERRDGGPMRFGIVER